MNIIAVDPGPVESAWVEMDETTLRPVRFAKEPNRAVRARAGRLASDPPRFLVIEEITSYGMAVGHEVFDTCIAVGRLVEVFRQVTQVRLFPRRDVKSVICGTPRANDAAVTRALVDRFAPGVRNNGKGVKAAPGWVWGFRADIWQAYALGVAALTAWVDDPASGLKSGRVVID
jgi:hypothetical protein